MKYVFDKNGIIDSENTERLVQYSINANELQVAFTDLNIREYVPYVAFERADGKVSPLIGMAFDRLNIGEEVYDCATYKFSDSWVTAVSGVLKVAIILKKNNVNARTSTFNLNVAESVSEDKVNYIDDVAYNELVARVGAIEQNILDITNGDIVVKEAQHALEANKATKDAQNNVIHETYATKEENVENLDTAKEYTDNKIAEIQKDIDDNLATKEELEYVNRQKATYDYVNNKIPTKTSQLTNDSGFITKLVDDLVNYYKKNEVLELINQIPKFNILKVEILPTENISETTIYLLRSESGEDDNYYIEYLYSRSGGWEIIGSTEINLEDFYNKEEINSLLETKVNEETILSDGTTFKFEKIGDVYRIKHADTNGNILQYIDFDFDELIISNNNSRWTMDNDGMIFNRNYTIGDKEYEFRIENVDNVIKLIVATFIDNIYYELGGITINEKGLSIQKLISLDNQSIDYINSIIDHAVLGIEENPRTLLNGKWKFKKDINTIDLYISYDVPFKDNLGNEFGWFSNSLDGLDSNKNIFLGGFGDYAQSETILLYNPQTKEGLAFSEADYYIEFKGENSYLLEQFKTIADKYVYKQFATEEYVDKAISNLNGNVDLSDYVKKDELDKTIGDINSILDQLNGEV